MIHLLSKRKIAIPMWNMTWSRRESLQYSARLPWTLILWILIWMHNYFSETNIAIQLSIVDWSSYYSTNWKRDLVDDNWSFACLIRKSETMVIELSAFRRYFSSSLSNRFHDVTRIRQSRAYCHTCVWKRRREETCILYVFRNVYTMTILRAREDTNRCKQILFYVNSMMQF